jgi:cell shape-determining protein MreD
MIYVYHLVVCLFLILFQTTLSTVCGPTCLYDLLVPVVVYLGVYRLPREALPVLILAGLAMDGISGGVFGVHLSAYLWLYVGVRWAIQFLHAGNAILLPMLVTIAVAFKSIVVAFSAVVVASAPWPVEAVFPVVSGQILWGALTGPLLMVALVRGQKVVDQTTGNFRAEKNSLGTP